MPVKLGNKPPGEGAEARIEIVPLIDIMFFLLASFMLVSLSMVRLKSVKVNLPTATIAATETKSEFTDISVDKKGFVFLDKKPVGDHELTRMLAGISRSDPNFRVTISADRDTRHGDVIHVLDLVHQAGIGKVAFEIEPSN